jgi:hypothetical protein
MIRSSRATWLGVVRFLEQTVRLPRIKPGFCYYSTEEAMKMHKTRESKQKSRLTRLISLLACTIFAASVFFPFLQAPFLRLVDRPENDYALLWSYKEILTVSYEGTGRKWLEYGFADYWTLQLVWGVTPALFPWLGIIAYTTFEFQIITVSAGVLAVFKGKRKLYLLQTLFAATTLVLLTLVPSAVSGYYDKIFQTGFWLTLASVILCSANLAIEASFLSARAVLKSA